MNIFTKQIAKLTLKALALVQTYTLTNPTFGKLLGGQATYAGKSIDENSAMMVSTAWACVRLLSQTIGYLPWAIYEQDGKGNSTRIDHDLSAVLIDSPNVDMTSVEFKEAKVTNLSLQGNCYSLKETRTDQSISALYPIPTCYVQNKISKDGEIYYAINDRGKWDDYPREKIWHVKGFGSNGLAGLSPIAYARQTLGLSLATEEFQARFFSAGAAPSWLVSIPNWLHPDQRVIARENIQRLVAGNENAHKAWLLEGGMTAQPGTMPLADAQFLELRGLTVDEVCRWFGVPPHLVAKLDRSTNNNIEQQSLEFIMYGLQHYLTRFESSATKWLFKPDERKRFFLRFNVDALLRADAVGRAALWSAGAQNGYLNRNEIRAKEGWNRSNDAGMDSYTVQSNLVPIDKLGALADKQAAPTPAPVVAPAKAPVP